MEYFLGAIISLITLIVFNRFSIKKVNKKQIVVKNSQAYTFDLVAPFIEMIEMTIEVPLRSQASKHYEESFLRILFLGDKAYWIKNHTLYFAEAMNGQVDEDTVSEVDTMGMDKVELEQTIYIVEKLREGLANDFGHPGNTQF